jgi:large subunit ribosomal protein L7/L12
MTRRYNSTEASAAAANPKISAIVDQISQLTLLETADLVASLKVRNSIGHHHHHRHPTNLS